MSPFEKVFNFMKKPWVITSYAVLVVLAYLYVDKEVASYFYHLNLRVNFPLLNVFTALGKWISYVVLFFAGGLYFRFIRVNAVYEARSWFLFGCVLITNLLCLILKIALSRARPELLFSSNEFGFYWFHFSKLYWSFPSGHTSTVISLAAGLGLLFPRHFCALLILALCVAASRIMLYYHYISDVMVAFYMAMLTVGLFYQYVKSKGFFKAGFVS